MPAILYCGPTSPFARMARVVSLELGIEVEEQVIDVYSAIEHHETSDFKLSRDYTVDGVIARLEGVLVRECEKGGTAASIKAAMDRAIDQLHAETNGTRNRARDVVVRTTEKLREKFDREGREKD